MRSEQEFKWNIKSGSILWVSLVRKGGVVEMDKCVWEKDFEKTMQ